MKSTCTAAIYIHYRAVNRVLQTFNLGTEDNNCRVPQCSVGIESELVYVYIYLCLYTKNNGSLVVTKNSFHSENTLHFSLNWAFIRYIYVCNAFGHGGPLGGQARVQDGVLTSYMDAAFVLLAIEGSEIWINRSLRFTQVGLLQLQRN